MPASTDSLQAMHEVITFYSYKGGTGRTMALANVACLIGQQLGSAGRVLAIDWDLEAPGLHYYLSPRAPLQFPPGHQGVVELFTRIHQSLPAERAHGDEDSLADELMDSLPLTSFVQETRAANVCLMTAGRVDDNYQSRLSLIDWEDLYVRCPGIYRAFARRLAREYAVVLIDSRTGMTDISSVCTALLPDKLVVVFTPNRQSLVGIERLVKTSTEYRQQSKDLRPLIVYPLPSRIDNQFESLRNLWRNGDHEQDVEGYQPQFQRIFQHAYSLEQCDLFAYFEEVQVQHSPEHSYGEPVAALDVGSTDRFSIVRSYQALVDWITASAAPWERLEDARARERLERSRAALSARSSETSQSDGLYLEQLEEIITLSRRVRGPTHRDTLRAMQQLIDASLKQPAERTRAIASLQELAQVLRELRGPPRWELIEYLLNAAGTLRQLGATGDADALRQTTIGTIEDDSLAQDGKGVTSVIGIADRLRTVNKVQEAALLVEYTLQRSRRVLGTEDPNSQLLIETLGVLCLMQGDFARARKLLEDALDRVCRTLGEGHPRTLSILDNLGLVFLSQGDLIAARQVQERVLNVYKHTVGDEHPSTLIAMRNLAETLRAEGELDSAKSMQMHVLLITQRLLGPKHPDALLAMRDLGITLDASGAHAEALTLYQQALAIAGTNENPIRRDLLQRVSILHSIEREMR